MILLAVLSAQKAARTEYLAAFYIFAEISTPRRNLSTKLYLKLKKQKAL